MAANGTNYRLHSWNPDNFGALPPIMVAEESWQGWLFPVKKVLRDTYINQYTWFIMAMYDPPDPPVEITAKICLYRAVNHISNTLNVGTTYFTKVAGSEVTVTNAGMPILAQTQWVLDAPIHLEGGTYAWAVLISTGALEGQTVIWQTMGITDSDSNIIFPKWNPLFVSPAFPATLTGANLPSRNTTDWQYISGEWQ